MTSGGGDGTDRPAATLRAELAGPAAADPGPAGLSFSPSRPMFWVAAVGIELFFSAMRSLSASRDLRRDGVDFAVWEPWTWEVTSTLALLALLPVLVKLVGRRPLSGGRSRVTALVYALAALLFSALHVLGMVALRYVVYALAGSRYTFGPVGPEFVYELRKDVMTFLVLVTLLNLLQEVERRLTAPLLVEERPPAPVVQAPASLLTIRDGGKDVRLAREVLVALRAAGNYVEVFLVNDRPLMIRATLADAESRLSGSGFVRVHRSWLVALDHGRALTPTGAGDYRAELTTDLGAPVSRRYKDALQQLRDALAARPSR